MGALRGRKNMYKDMLYDIIIKTQYNAKKISRNYPVLCSVDGRKRSFLLQIALPELKVAFEVEDPENEWKQRLCFDENAYFHRMEALKEAGWMVTVFNAKDVHENKEAVTFYVRHAIGLGPKANMLESTVIPKLTPLQKDQPLEQ